MSDNLTPFEKGLQKIQALKEVVKDFPLQSGVYLMKNNLDKIIYVGKAKSLRNRVRSYLTDSKDHSAKTRALVFNIQSIEYILTKTEVEAFLLEASLIKKYKPKYNIRLKDDKAYPYIKFTLESEYPRLYLARKVVKDGAQYYGPFTSGGAVFGTMRFLNRIFKIRDCTDHVFKTRNRPCLTHQIGRCTAPCVSLISKEQYYAEVKGAHKFLRGQSQSVIKDIEKKMYLAAEQEQFEVAARLRDSMRALQNVQSKQSVVSDNTEVDQDFISYFGDQRGVVIEILHVRAGRVIGARPHFMSEIDMTSPQESVQEWLVSFMNQYYEDNFVPDEIYTHSDLGQDLNKLLAAVFLERSQKNVVVQYPLLTAQQKLMDMSAENAQSHFEKIMAKETAKQEGLTEIQRKLHLPKLPLRIECYDISHFQGDETVASQVVFENGRPAKEHYRRYKIKTVSGIDDFKSMYEVLERRFNHDEYEEPDLIVVDGGKGQLSQAVRILQEIHKEHIPVVGLAKARTQSDFTSQEVTSTEERFFIPGRANPVTFKTNSEAHHILTGLRDEAHRFAITFHRERRDKKSFASVLDEISGLGEKRKHQLLKKFQTIEAIKEAEVEEISELPSFNRILAERILIHLNEEEEGG